MLNSVERGTKKKCSFYVSDNHLIVKLFYYLKNEKQKKKEIYTIFEKSLEENIEILSRNMGDEEFIKRLKGINWKRYKSQNQHSIQEMFKDLKNKEGIDILIAGRKDFIDTINSSIKLYNKNNIDINIVDCYDISDLNININEIIKSYESILDTEGEKPIEEIFEG